MLLNHLFNYSTINIRGDVFEITLVDNQQPRPAATILKHATTVLIPQFTTSGSLINPYWDNIFSKTSGNSFTPTNTPNSTPNAERMTIPKVIDHLILLDVIPID